MTQSCIRWIESIYGVKGDNLTLVCPFAPPKENGMTTWFGPPSFTIYFYNEVKNPKDLKGRRLSVVKKTTEAYDFTITNIKRQEDKSIYSCDVYTNPLQQQLFNLTFYGNSIIFCFIVNFVHMCVLWIYIYINCGKILNSMR